MTNLVFGILARDDGSEKLDRFGKAAERAHGRLHAFGSAAITAGGRIRGGLGVAGAGLAGLAAGAAALGISAAPKLLDMGVRMEALGNKAKVVFGGSLPVVQRWADVAAEKMGLTRKEATGLAAGLGDLLTPMGFTQARAASMSTQITDLAAAFSQWSNGTMSTSDAADMLSDALTGEYDSLKSVGVQLDVATVQDLLHKAGKDKLTGAALKQATAEVALAEITRQSGNAISGYTQGNNKLAIAKAKLTARVGELKERIVGALIPAMTTATTWLGEKLPGAASKAGEWFSRNKENLAGLGLVGVQVFEKVGAGVLRFGSYATLAFKGVLIGIKGIFGAILEFAAGTTHVLGMLPGSLGLPWRVAEAGIRKYEGTVVGSLNTAIGQADKTSKTLGHMADVTDTAARRAADLRRRMLELRDRRLTIEAIDRAKPVAERIQRAIGALRGKTVRIQVTQAGTVQMVQRLIDRIHGKDVVIGVQYGPVRGASVAKAQHGLRNSPVGHWSMVGEAGRELMWVPKGADIYDHQDTEAMVRNMRTNVQPPGAGGGMVVNITVNGALDPAGVALQIQRLLLKLKRDQGAIGLGLA